MRQDREKTSAGEKRYTEDTHRTARPDETIARVTPFMKEMGITRISNVTHLDRIGIPVVMVVRPNSRSVAVSQGKGLTLNAARASGLMEAVENWHAERISLPVRYASYDDLRRDCRVVDIEALPLIRDSLYEPTRRLLWIEGRNLVDGESVWVPYEMVHTDYTHPAPSGHGCFACSTNGLASGNHWLEAVCHAICELIERDASSLWYHAAPGVRAKALLALDTVTDAACRNVLDRLCDAGIKTVVWDVTSDLEVPSFQCFILEPGNRLGHVGAGAGCHPSRNVGCAVRGRGGASRRGASRCETTPRRRRAFPTRGSTPRVRRGRTRTVD